MLARIQAKHSPGWTASRGWRRMLWPPPRRSPSSACRMRPCRKAASVCAPPSSIPATSSRRGASRSTWRRPTSAKRGRPSTFPSRLRSSSRRPGRRQRRRTVWRPWASWPWTARCAGGRRAGPGPEPPPPRPPRPGAAGRQRCRGCAGAGLGSTRHDRSADAAARSPAAGRLPPPVALPSLSRPRAGVRFRPRRTSSDKRMPNAPWRSRPRARMPCSWSGRPAPARPCWRVVCHPSCRRSRVEEAIEITRYLQRRRPAARRAAADLLTALPRAAPHHLAAAGWWAAAAHHGRAKSAWRTSASCSWTSSRSSGWQPWRAFASLSKTARSPSAAPSRPSPIRPASCWLPP